MSGKIEKLSTAGGFAAIVMWSATFAIARSLSEQVGPLTAGVAVYFIGGLLGSLRLVGSPGKALESWRKLTWQYLIGCGTLFVVYTVAIYLAVGLVRERGQLLEIALINYLWPGLTVLLSIPLLGRRSSWWLWPGTALALTGVFLVMTQAEGFAWKAFAERVQASPLAYGLALVAAICWALYSNLARRWAGTEGGGGVEAFLLVTALALLGFRCVLPEAGAWTGRAILEACGLAVCTTVGYVLWDVAMRRGNHLLVATGSYFTPLLSTVVSSVYLGVTPKPQLWVGCLVLIVGSLVSWRSVTDEQT